MFLFHFECFMSPPKYVSFLFIYSLKLRQQIHTSYHRLEAVCVSCNVGFWFYWWLWNSVLFLILRLVLAFSANSEFMLSSTVDRRLCCFLFTSRTLLLSDIPSSSCKSKSKLFLGSLHGCLEPSINLTGLLTKVQLIQPKKRIKMTGLEIDILLFKRYFSPKCVHTTGMKGAGLTSVKSPPPP